MSSIHEEIKEEIKMALNDCYRLTGARATRLYLGRTQISKLMKDPLFYDTNADFLRQAQLGDKWPKIMGMAIYEVNDECHCVAAVVLKRENK